MVYYYYEKTTACATYCFGGMGGMFVMKIHFDCIFEMKNFIMKINFLIIINNQMFLYRIEFLFINRLKIKKSSKPEKCKNIKFLKCTMLSHAITIY